MLPRIVILVRIFRNDLIYELILYKNDGRMIIKSLIFFEMALILKWECAAADGF